ncbi:hypothetical protein LJR030_004023 [Rhizobium sp. LjRoot30]
MTLQRSIDGTHSIDIADYSHHRSENISIGNSETGRCNQQGAEQ